MAEDMDDIDTLDDMTQDDMEARARAQGWVSEDDWDHERAEREGKKPPARFLTAKEFLERTSSSMPIMNERIRKLERDLSAKDRQIKEAVELVKDQQKQHREAMDRKAKEYKAELDARLMQAGAEGDVEAVAKVNKEIKDLHEQEIAEARKGTAAPADDTGEAKPGGNHVVDAWVMQNKDWFQDPKRAYLNQLMLSKYEAINADNPGMDTRQALEKAKREVMQRFPEEFGAPARRSNPVEGGGMNQGGSGKSVNERFAALPADAQAAYQRDVQRLKALGVTFTKEEYLKDYGA